MNIYEQLILEIGVDSAIKRFGGKLDPTVIRFIGKNWDPSSSKKYTEWIVMDLLNANYHPKAFKNFELYVQEKVRINDLDWSDEQELKTIIQSLLNLKSWLIWYDDFCKDGYIAGKDADIYSFKDRTEFYPLVYAAMDKKHEKHENDYTKKSKYHGPLALRKQIGNWLVIKPKDKYEAMYWGQGSNWCISTKSANKFDGYFKKFIIYILKSENDMLCVCQNRHDLNDFDVWTKENHRKNPAKSGFMPLSREELESIDK